MITSQAINVLRTTQDSSNPILMDIWNLSDVTDRFEGTEIEHLSSQDQTAVALTIMNDLQEVIDKNGEGMSWETINTAIENATAISTTPYYEVTLLNKVTGDTFDVIFSENDVTDEIIDTPVDQRVYHYDCNRNESISCIGLNDDEEPIVKVGNYVDLVADMKEPAESNFDMAIEPFETGYEQAVERILFLSKDHLTQSTRTHLDKEPMESEVYSGIFLCDRSDYGNTIYHNATSTEFADDVPDELKNVLALVNKKGFEKVCFHDDGTTFSDMPDF